MAGDGGKRGPKAWTAAAAAGRGWELAVLYSELSTWFYIRLGISYEFLDVKSYLLFLEK